MGKKKRFPSSISADVKLRAKDRNHLAEVMFSDTVLEEDCPDICSSCALAESARTRFEKLGSEHAAFVQILVNENNLSSEVQVYFVPCEEVNTKDIQALSNIIERKDSNHVSSMYCLNKFEKWNKYLFHMCDIGCVIPLTIVRSFFIRIKNIS